MNNKNIEIQATVFLKHGGRISLLGHAVTARIRNGKQWSQGEVCQKIRASNGRGSATYIDRKRS